LSYRTLSPLLPSVGRRIAEELLKDVQIRVSLPSHSFSISEQRVSVEVIGRHFLWSIVYEMWCSEEDTHPGIGDGILDLLAWPWGYSGSTTAVVARVPVPIRDGHRDFSRLDRICSAMTRCDADPRNIHQYEGTGRYPLLVSEIPGILRTAPGWRATGKPPSPPTPCPKGVAHPFHYDCFGWCRCASDAVIHYPLLQQWLNPTVAPPRGSP
jgi:hypothetical protein